jgi:hypothetical protein
MMSFLLDLLFKQCSLSFISIYLFFFFPYYYIS